MSQNQGVVLMVPADATNKNLVFIPNKTSGIYKGNYFLLKGGRLVTPYSANTYDMERDAAIEVEQIKIIEGPHKGLIGWLPSAYLQRLLTLSSL